MFVHQILSAKPNQDVISIQASQTVADAANILSSKRIGALVVSEDGSSAEGILSERDIVRELGKRGAKCMGDTVADLMTKNPVSCSKNDTAESVLNTMTQKRFRHMPVTEDGKLVGMITIGDVVKARLSEVALEKDALVDMIAGH